MKHYGLDIPEGSDITNLTVPSGNSNPSNPNAGELFFRTDQDALQIHNGTGWNTILVGTASGPVVSQEFTATAGQTIFTVTGGYTVGNIEVFLNGVRLDQADYTATNGTTVVLSSGAALNDTLYVYSFVDFSVSNHYTKTESDAAFAPITRSRKNHIINGNFDIWQRATSQTSSGYGSVDRWTNIHSGSSKTHSRQSFTIGQTDVPNNPKYYSRTVVTSSAGASNYAAQIQLIEDVTKLSGKTITLSFWAKADASKNIATEFRQSFGSGGSPSSPVSSLGVTTHALTTSWQKFTTTVALPSVSGKTLGTDENDALQLSFWFDAGSDYDARTNSLGQQSGTFDIAQVQLEEGSVATDFEYRPIGEELALCQRYYQQGQAGSGNATTFSGNVTSGAGYQARKEFAQEMRTVPTLTSSNSGNTNFPTTTSLSGGYGGFVETRTANATGPGGFISNWTADAEL